MSLLCFVAPAVASANIGNFVQSFDGRTGNTIRMLNRMFLVPSLPGYVERRKISISPQTSLDRARAQERKTGHVDAMLCFLAFISAVHGDIETRFVDCPSGHVISSDAFSSQETTCPWTGLLLVES